MEALVVARALKFAFEIGVDKAFLEDVSVVNESFDWRWWFLMPYGFMVEDVKHCSQFFIQLHYYHTRKESNNIVHRLDMQ